MRPLLLAAGLLALAAAAPAGAGEEIVPNENLVLDGIPKLPSAIADGVGRYTEFRAALFRSWHPTRREMLVTTRFADTNQIHLVKTPGGARRQLTFFPDRVTGAEFPRRAVDYFVFTKDKGGDEFRQLYRYDLASGAVTLLSDGGRSQNSLGPWSHAGDRLAYGSTRRNGADRDLYVVDPKDPKSDRKLAEVQGSGWAVSDWSPDDKLLLVVEDISANESYLWLVDAGSGEKRLLTPKGGQEKIAYSGGYFSGDGKGVYVTCDKDSEFQRLTYLDLASGKHTYLTPQIHWDVEAFDLSPDGRTIAFVTNDEGVSVLHLLDTATRKEVPAPKLPLGVIDGVTWHANGRELSLSLSEARSPYDVYSADVASGKLDRWTESETGGLVTSVFAVPELVRFESFDGREITGFLYKPPVRFSGPRPVVINIHGGPESQERPDFMGRSTYYLDELGVAMILPNVRGSSGYGKTFLTLDNGTKREDSVKDIGALLDWIGTRPDLDASRVMVMGSSYGGYMTLAVAATYGDRIRCSLDVVGISNFVTFLEHTEAYRRDLRRVEYGDERNPKMREFLLGISPLNRADRMRKPMFIIQGQNDPRVNYRESEQMVAQLKKQGTPVWYLKAMDEGHGFAKKKNADFQLYATVAFMQEFLLK